MLQETTLAAYHDLKVAGLAPRASEVLQVLKDVSPAGLTGYQIAVKLCRHPYVVRPRLTDMANKGLVIQTGQKRLNPNGKQEIVWVLADPQGQKVFGF